MILYFIDIFYLCTPMNIDNFHPILLKAGIAYHNGDWNWKNVRST